MVASPTPIPEPRSSSSDPLDIPRPSHGSTMSRSPFGAFSQSGLGSSLSPSRYYTPHQASIASQWQSARENSFSKTTAQGLPQITHEEHDLMATSAPTHRSAAWPSMPTYDPAKLREPINFSASASGTPFTQLYRQLSNSRRRSQSSANPQSDGPGFSSSFGSSTSDSPTTPQPQQDLETSMARRYAKHLEHVDADGMWSQPAMVQGSTPASKIAESDEEPSFRRSLQRHLSAHTKRKPSPMGERMLMGHLDTH